ncbi:MAG: hypothetical protein RIC30_03375 [Marinoscillum sp.]|uniref:hypothetical protein n=1 Tax=Marinoscillum sp. TaxID=2024838 RepID=UPI0032FA1AC2
MKEILVGMFVFCLSQIFGHCQKFADIKLKGSDTFVNVSIAATSSTQFYTNEDGDFKFESIDSVVLFFEPSESLLSHLENKGVSFYIKRMSLEEIEEVTGENIKTSLDWVILSSGDSLHGYIEGKTQSIIFRNPVESENRKISNTDIISYKNNGVIYENFGGMKALEIRGNLSLYTDTLKTNVPANYYSPYGDIRLGGSSSSSVIYYFVKRQDEEKLTLLWPAGILRNSTFKKTATNYFEECPDLVDRINRGWYTKNHIKEMVQFYNTNCSK